MTIPIYTVDAFTHTAFTGNPAAVCLLPVGTESTPEHEAWMQNVAAEMNLAETAFLSPTDRSDVFALRWFTPTTEVDLCGHATIASAHVLWSTNRVPNTQPITFQTLSGDLVSQGTGSGKITLDMPMRACIESAPIMELTVALNVEPKSVHRNEQIVLIELESEQNVVNFKPDFYALRSVKSVKGTIITAPSSPENAINYDFVSRFFAPQLGIDEDPVTGSAHCALAPFWANRLGKTKLIGYQASKRGGFVGVEVVGDRVVLEGDAVTVVEGVLFGKTQYAHQA